MTLLLAIDGGRDSWAAERWRERFRLALPGRSVVVEGADDYDKNSIRFAAVWKPVTGFLATLPHLDVIFNLGAGVDAVLADPTLPNVPLVRVINSDLTRRMTEYVTLHVLMHHRRMLQLMRAQASRQWQPEAQWAARALRVGIMGFGTLGQDAADVLQRLGFQVAGFSRKSKIVTGFEIFSGDAQLSEFLARSDILVVLVPLTDATRGLLNRELFGRLARDGVMGAPVLINAGRGGLQVEADILAALNDGTLGGASLDVFETEPLPRASPLWTHPNVIVTPHNAADSDPEAIASDVARQIVAYEHGAGLGHVVDRALGY